MQFGICAPLESAAAVKAAGWEFVEEGVQGLLQGQLPDAEWKGLERVKKSVLPVPAANVLVPGSLKITGPTADLEKLRTYMSVVLRRAEQVGMKILVFGSGGARNIPDGFDREQGRQQIIAFAKMSAEIAGRHGVTIVAEHLNKKECNVINSVAEAMTYVRAVNHPNFQCLVDSYHFWVENESLESLKDAMPFIKHVHLADKDGRVPPGESGTSDYRPFFKVIKQAGYNQRISVESPGFNDIAGLGPKILALVKKQWTEA